MGYNYTVWASRYPYKGQWENGQFELAEDFETLDEAINYVKKCQSNGYVIIDIQIRDFEVSE